jgi:uncharacterized protein
MMKITSVLIFVFFCWMEVVGNPIPVKPNPPRLVNDLAGVLNDGAREQLEAHLAGFARETSTQIVLVTVPTLDGYEVADYAVRLAHDWGVGQGADDNGIVLLVKPRYDNEKGQAFVAVGYGLEGAVPDATARRIVDNEMIPHFRNEDYYSGMLSAVNVLMELTRGEYTSEAYLNRTGSEQSTFGAVFVLIFAIIMITVFSKSKRARESSIGHSLPFFAMMALMGSGSRRHGGHFGNFSSGGGSFGGGGGFGGFGGGGFGGGGAGGSW